MNSANPENSGSHRSTTGAVFRNSALFFMSRIVSASASLCAVPFFIHWLGLETYGVWETFLSLGVVVCLPLTILNSTLFWWMTQAYGKGDKCTVTRFAGIGCTSTVAYLFLMLPLFWLVRAHLIVAINAPQAGRAELSTILVITAGILVCGGVAEVMTHMLAAVQRLGDAVIAQTIGRLLLIGISLRGLQAGYGLRGMIAGQATGLAVQTLIIFILMRQNYSDNWFYPQFPTRDELRSLYRYARLMTVCSLMSILKEQTDKLILATCASPVWVGYYSVAHRLAGLLLEFNRFFYQPFMAATGLFHARGDNAGVQVLYHRVLMSVAVCTGLVLIIVVGGSDPLLVLWMGQALPDVTMILVLLVIANSATVLLTGPQTALCRGTGRIQTETVYLLVFFLSNLAGTILLVYLVGPMGTVYSTAISSLGCGLFFTRLFHRNMQMSLTGVIRAGYVYFIALFFACLAKACISFFPGLSGRATALVSLLVVVLPLAVMYFAVLVRVGLVEISEIKGLLVKR